ncbi:MAG TPA: MlaD family protein [Saprospiraceae bacterium]|nr:MlaD family protein [Saprospiraceae bacterium]
MKKKKVNAVKLGLFVLAGLLILVFTLYTLSKNKTWFGSSLELKTRFRDVNGLLLGNNVRFSGIDVGSVNDIRILNDTTVEVTLTLDKNMRQYIRTNSLVSLGTDGLIGNRVINISTAAGNAPFVQGGELLPSKEEVNTEKMLQTLYGTNEKVSKIAEGLLETIQLINTSSELSSLLNDKSISANLRSSLYHLHETSLNASLLMKESISTLHMATEGKGTLAVLLKDTTLSSELKQAVSQIQALENSTQRLVTDVNQMANVLEKDIQQGDGTINTLLRDSLMAANLRATIENAEKGTAAFAENMEALKSNILLKKYFRKKAQRDKKAQRR